MIPIQALLVSEHLADLRREAAAARLAREAARAAGDTFGGDMFDGNGQPPRRPDVRRMLARAAVRLSLLADGAAHRLDPCLEEAFGKRRATGAAGR